MGEDAVGVPGAVDAASANMAPAGCLSENVLSLCAGESLSGDLDVDFQLSRAATLSQGSQSCGEASFGTECVGSLHGLFICDCCGLGLRLQLYRPSRASKDWQRFPRLKPWA